MTTEIGTIADLTTFSGHDHATDEDQRKAYINTIFLAHNSGLSPRWLSELINSGESLLLSRFFNEFQCAPYTKLAQLLQVIVYETSLGFAAVRRFRNNPTNTWALETTSTILPETRRIKWEIAQEIFGDERLDYTERLTNVFFAHRFTEMFPMPGVRKYQRMQERDRILHALIDEISARFPEATPPRS